MMARIWNLASVERSLVALTCCLALIFSLAARGIAAVPKPTPENLAPPPIDHILLEVKDLKRSMEFYQNHLGLRLKKKSGDFVMLESGNVGIYLWSKHWPWNPPPPSNPRSPSGMYPHFAVPDTKALL